MIAFLKRQDLYDISIRVSKDSYESEDECMNDWIEGRFTLLMVLGLL